MIKKIGAVALAAIAFQACNGPSETITTESGLTINVLKAGTDEIEPGKTLLIDFVVKNENDSVILDTSVDGLPRPARKADSLWDKNKGGIEEVMFNLKKGDSIYCVLPAVKLFGGTTPPGIELNESMHISLAVRDAMTGEEFRDYAQKMQEERSKEQLESDIAAIDEYLAENNIEAQQTESGLRYIISEQGEGENVKSGDTISANYSGYVLGGEYFDSSIEEIAKEQGVYMEGREYGPFQTVIGKGAVIKGWDEGFQLLNKGSKATFYIPSPLAYGPRARSKQIGPNSILVFELELLEITSPQIAE